MIRRLSIGLLAAAVAMISNPLEAKSGNHEAGKVYEYEYLAETPAVCGNWSLNTIFYYSDKPFESDKVFELIGAQFLNNRLCSLDEASDQVVG